MIREQRYFVFKVKDIEKYLTDEQQLKLDALATKINLGRLKDGKQPVQCVCVEDDWPEYEKVWAMIAARVDGASLPAAEDARDARDAARYRWLRDNCELTRQFRMAGTFKDEDGNTMEHQWFSGPAAIHFDSAIDAAMSQDSKGEQPTLICPRCKVDRFKAPCPAPTGNCPMVGEAQDSKGEGK